MAWVCCQSSLFPLASISHFRNFTGKRIGKYLIGSSSCLRRAAPNILSEQFENLRVRVLLKPFAGGQIAEIDTGNRFEDVGRDVQQQPWRISNSLKLADRKPNPSSPAIGSQVTD